MNIATVKKLMKEVCCGALGTTDGQKVGVRPMSGWAWMEKELWCATFEDSDKITQLRKVPYAEYCFCNKDGLHVRIAGPCTISSDNADKLRLYEANSSLKDHIEDPASPEYVVIRLKPESIRLMNPPELVYQNIKLE